MVDKSEVGSIKTDDNSIEKQDYGAIKINDSHNNTPVISQKIAVTIMLLLFLGQICLAFCSDNPVPLQTQLQEKLSLSTTQYSLFFSVYCLPNMICPLFGGFFADKFGRGIAIIVVSIIMLLGQFLFASGISTASYVNALAGRLVFGIGSETYNLICFESSSFWNFSFVTFSMALVGSGTRLGSTINDIALPYIYDSSGNLALGFWIGLALTGVILLSSIAFCIIDYCALKEVGYTNGYTHIALSGVSQFPAIFWLLILSNAFLDGVMYTYNTICSGMAQVRFGFDVESAGLLIAIPLIIVIVGNPLFGYIIDRTKRFTLLLMIASSLTVVNFAFLCVIPNAGHKNLVYLFHISHGVAISLYISAFWPCIKFAVPGGLTSTAYGTAYCMNNALLFISNISVGIIVDTTIKSSGGYFWAAFFIFCMAIVSVAFTILIMLCDYRRNFNNIYNGIPCIEDTNILHKH